MTKQTSLPTITSLFIAALLMSSSHKLLSDELPVDKNPQIDFALFLNVASEAGDYRKDRLISFEKFQEMAKSPDTIILDTRSKENYESKHLKGAIHLNFSEMTTEDLRKVIPSKDTRILIYCNNNFKNNSPAFTLKSVPMALNIPTFITLYDYGYRNLYELGSVVDENDPKVPFQSKK